jgi:hypothetical protein
MFKSGLKKGANMRLLICILAVTAILVSPARSFGLGLDTTMIPSLSLKKTASFVGYSEKTYIWSYGTIIVYSNISGQVFAISWSGSRSPSLASLGIQDTRTPGIFHNPHEENRIKNDFRLIRGGVMGHLRGKAWIPSIVPPGLSLPDGLP